MKKWKIKMRKFWRKLNEEKSRNELRKEREKITKGRKNEKKKMMMKTEVSFMTVLRVGGLFEL